MNAESPFTMVARLESVDWFAADVESRAHSRVKLMEEYLRRAALWANYYSAGGHWPFGDIVAYVAPGFELDSVLERQVELVLDRPGIGGFGQRLARAAVRWAALPESRSVALPELPAPYEPLVMMFERGGAFSEEVFIDLFGASLPRGTLETRASQPPFPLSRRTLDALDILHTPGKRTFYLLPTGEPSESSPALIRRISFGADSQRVDASLDSRFRWLPTTALSDVESSAVGWSLRGSIWIKQ